MSTTTRSPHWHFALVFPHQTAATLKGHWGLGIFRRRLDQAADQTIEFLEHGHLLVSGDRTLPFGARSAADLRRSGKDWVYLL